MAIDTDTTNTPAAGQKDCKSVAKTYSIAAGSSFDAAIAADTDLNGNIPTGKKATVSVQVQICIEDA